ncbi:FHA domain-containing protein [Nocardia sp. IFM 10818]
MSARAEVVPGAHLVARVDGVVVVVAHRDADPITADSTAITVLETLLQLVREAASRETRRTGRTFARLVSTWLMSREDEERVEFGVLTPGQRGLAVFLHGGVTAVLDHGERVEILHGRDAGFSVDRVVSPMPARAAAVFIDEESPREDLPPPGVWSLREGRLPGGGAVLWLDDQDEPASGAATPKLRKPRARTPDPAPAEDPETDHLAEEPVNGAQVASKAAGAGAAAARASRAAAASSAPVPQRHSTPTPAAPRGVTVRGFTCARHHLNDPRVSFCAVCGIRMDQLTCVLTEGLRPPLGVLLLDDGTSYVLDTDIVIGREPERSTQVRHGAHPIRIEDASGGMSRVHAEIRLMDWEVTVIDRGSANGTHIRPPNHPVWIRATPGQPVILDPGTQILLGGRTFTFDSQHGQI